MPTSIKLLSSTSPIRRGSAMDISSSVVNRAGEADGYKMAIVGGSLTGSMTSLTVTSMQALLLSHTVKAN